MGHMQTPELLAFARTCRGAARMPEDFLARARVSQTLRFLGSEDAMRRADAAARIAKLDLFTIDGFGHELPFALLREYTAVASRLERACPRHRATRH